MNITERTLKNKRDSMTREAWVKNVMKIEEKTREEAEALYDKIFSNQHPSKHIDLQNSPELR